MRKLSILLSLMFALAAGQSAWGQCSDLFFSEYLEGSSNNKALEIYNPTSDSVDLTDYVLYRFNNGSLIASDSLFPQGTLLSKDVYVIGNPSAIAAILTVSDTTHTLTFFNGDDALCLINKITGDTLDVFGIIGNDPGTNWPVGTGATSEFTLVRMASVNAGTTDWAIGATQWEVFAQNFSDSLGAHSMTPCANGMGPCSNLFFSEYLEGSSNNKAIEIYNASSSAIDLSRYQVQLFTNGSATVINTLRMFGMLEADSVYVIANASANATILGQADTTSNVTFYNGDDVLVLIDTVNSDTLDIIGIIGVDPGTNWPVGTGATSEFTLVRMSSIHEGTTNWAIGATQWDVYAQNFADSLGSHYMVPCGTVITGPSAVSLGVGNIDVAEAAGSVSIQLLISPTTADCSVSVSLTASGTATAGADFTFSSPDTVTFMASGSALQTLVIPITNDLLNEGNETFVLKIDSLMGCSIGQIDSIVVTILDDDAPIPVYPISLITADADGNGVADSTGILCEVRGVVYGFDIRGGNGVQFTIRDSTDGIGVFSSSTSIGYTTVREGDSLHVIGIVGEFNGLVQMGGVLDTIIVVDSSRVISAPVVVDSLGEYTESELIKIECVKLVNPAQWTGTGSGFTPDITNGTTTFALRIDNDVDLYALPAPTGYFSVVGLGGQFDSSVPKTAGYQILPRYAADIIPIAAPAVSFTADTISVSEAAASVTVSVDFTGLNPDTTEVWITLDAAASTATNGQDFTFAGDTLYQFGSCGAMSMEDVVITLTDDAVIEGNETIVLYIEAVINGVAAIDTVVITLVDDITDAIDNLLPSQAISMYPNPGDRQVVLESISRMERVRVLDLSGKVIADNAINDVRTNLNTDALSNGIYLIEVTTAEGRWIQKWVKNKQ